jgi:hypothetical protein
MIIKYVIPVGSKITRKFYCPALKKLISLREDFTEDEIIFNSRELKSVDSGLNFSYFRFTIGATNYENESIISKFDVHYSVSAEYVQIKTEKEAA